MTKSEAPKSIVNAYIKAALIWSIVKLVNHKHCFQNILAGSTLLISASTVLRYKDKILVGIDHPEGFVWRVH